MSIQPSLVHVYCQSNFTRYMFARLDNARLLAENTSRLTDR
jgi:hypothetical protein